MPRPVSRPGAAAQSQITAAAAAAGQMWARRYIAWLIGQKRP